VGVSTHPISEVSHFSAVPCEHQRPVFPEATAFMESGAFLFLRRELFALEDAPLRSILGRGWPIFGLNGDDNGPRMPVSLRRQKIDSTLPDHDGSLFLGDDGEGTPDLAHVPLQVVRDGGMDVDDDDDDLPRPDVLLVDEVRVQVTSAAYSPSAAWRRSPLSRSAQP